MASGRYQPTGLVRVVDYPDPYPDRSAKVVSLEDFGTGSPAGGDMRAEADRARDG